MKKIVKKIFLISLSVALTLTIFVFAHSNIPFSEDSDSDIDADIIYEVDEELQEVFKMFEELYESGVQVDATQVRLEVDGVVIVENGIAVKPEANESLWGVCKTVESIDITMQMLYRISFPGSKEFCSSGLVGQDNDRSYNGVLRYVTHRSVSNGCQEFQLVTYKGTINQDIDDSIN